MNIPTRTSRPERLEGGPALVEGQVLRAVLNAADGPLTTTPSSWTLAILDGRFSEVQRLPAALSVVSPQAGQQYAVVELVPTGLKPRRKYYLALLSNTDQVLYLAGPYPYLTAAAAAQDGYSSLSYRHSDDLFQTPYSLLAADFRQQVHLQLFAAERESRGERVVYQSVTSGQPRTLQHYRQGAVSLESVPLSPDSLRGLEATVMHQDWQLGAQSMLLAEAFGVQAVGNTALQRAKFWAIDTAMSDRLVQGGAA